MNDPLNLKIKSGAKIFDNGKSDAINDFINAVEKRPTTEKIDWDKIHYSQFEI